MPDLAERFPQNPILVPQDIAPSRPDLSIECLLNPGAFRFDHKTWLLLRVAERSPRDYQAWEYLEMAYRHLGKDAERVDAARKGLALVQDEPTAP